MKTFHCGTTVISQTPKKYNSNTMFPPSLCLPPSLCSIHVKLSLAFECYTNTCDTQAQTFEKTKRHPYGTDIFIWPQEGFMKERNNCLEEVSAEKDLTLVPWQA